MHETPGEYGRDESVSASNARICRRTLAIVSQHPQHDGHMKILVGDMICNSPDVCLSDFISFRPDPVQCGKYARRMHKLFTEGHPDLLRGKTLPQLTNAMASDLVSVLLASSIESIHDQALKISGRLSIPVPDPLKFPVRFDDTVVEDGKRITCFHAVRVRQLDIFLHENQPVFRGVGLFFLRQAIRVREYREQDQLQALSQFGKKRDW